MRSFTAMFRVPTVFLGFLCAALQVGCSTEAVYTQESFSADSPFTMKLKEDVATTCESARRALLGQGYRIEESSGDQVKGRKSYRSSDSLSTFIEMNVVCVSERSGSTLYANGVLSTYDLKRNNSAASVGVSAVGSISLPIGRSVDSLVKIAEETINDKVFYSRFFAAVDYSLAELRQSDDDTAPVEQKPAAVILNEPGPVIIEEPGPGSASPEVLKPAQPSTPMVDEPEPLLGPQPGPPMTAPAAAADQSAPIPGNDAAPEQTEPEAQDLPWELDDPSVPAAPAPQAPATPAAEQIPPAPAVVSEGSTSSPDGENGGEVPGKQQPQEPDLFDGLDPDQEPSSR